MTCDVESADRLAKSKRADPSGASLAAEQREHARIKALADLHILDTPAEPGFDDAVLVATQLCDVPIALVSLVDGHRQWFKAAAGVNLTETPREVSFCSHAVGGTDLLIIEDATLDARVADNPLVTGEPFIRFYAEEALELITAHPEISVLFTDINMPGPLDGLELARRVHEDWPAVQLVITSGRVTPGCEDIPEDGHFIAKLYQPQAVADLLRSICR